MGSDTMISKLTVPLIDALLVPPTKYYRHKSRLTALINSFTIVACKSARGIDVTANRSRGNSHRVMN